MRKNFTGGIYHMKKTVSLLVTAAILAALAGCGDAQNDNSGGSSVNHISLGGFDSSTTTDDAPAGVHESSPQSGAPESTGDNVITTSSVTDGDDPFVTATPQDGEMSGSVFVLEDGRALELFGGGYERGTNYAETVNQLKRLVGDNVNVFSLVAPKAVSFYLPDKYLYMTGSQWDNIENINEHFDGIIPVDAYTALSRHVDEEIYFRTDHHWQQLGAYYAAEEFAKTAQVPFAPLSDYEKTDLEGYVGTMYGFSNEDPRVKNNPDVFTFYKPKNEYNVTYYYPDLTLPHEDELIRPIDGLQVVQWYQMFLRGDGEEAHIHTDVGNGRKLVIVKDSYGNAFAPCLTSSFEDIWVVDMRGFKGSISQLVKDEGLTDVLFCMCSFSATGENQYMLADKL